MSFAPLLLVYTHSPPDLLKLYFFLSPQCVSTIAFTTFPNSPFQLPIAGLPDNLCQLLQPELIHLIKPFQLGTVNINDPYDLFPIHQPFSLLLPAAEQTHLPVIPTQNRYDNFTLAVSITSNMSRKRLNIPYYDRLPLRRSFSAYSTPECDSLACDFALKGPEN